MGDADVSPARFTDDAYVSLNAGVLHHVAASQVASRTLIGDKSEGEVSPSGHSAFDHRFSGTDHGGDARLHITCSPAVDLAIGDFSAQGVPRPPVADGPDVDMTVHEEGAPAAASTEHREKAGPFRSGLEKGIFETERFEVIGDRAGDEFLISGRIFGIDFQDGTEKADYRFFSKVKIHDSTATCQTWQSEKLFNPWISLPIGGILVLQTLQDIYYY
jgi:hypothetical protein